MPVPPTYADPVPSKRDLAWQALRSELGDLEVPLEPGPVSAGEFGWTLEQYAGSLRVVRTDLGALRARQLNDALRQAANDALDPELQLERELEGVNTFLEEARSIDSEGRVSRELEDGRTSTRGRVSGWSYKSRLNLLRTVSECRTEGDWGMVTLTLPGNWNLYVPTPDDWRRVLLAFHKRNERPSIWKVETQRRSAPHAHIGVELDLEHLGDLREKMATDWHELVVHQGDTCPGLECPELEHLLHGCQVDVRWSERARGKSLASYFAKHGVWSSKEYQNTTAGEHLRQGAVLMSLLSGVPLPAEFFVPLEERLKTYETRPLEFGPTSIDAAWGGMLELVQAWEYPGRWWGVRGVDRPRGLERTLDGDEVEALRLICRKLFTRRTTRVELYQRPDGSVVTSSRTGKVLRWRWRRSLRSLRQSAGWWMLSSDPEGLVPWLLERAAELAQVPKGIPRARWLIGLREPTDSTELNRSLVSFG